jgi:hypothetical protein
VYRRA